VRVSSVMAMGRMPDRPSRAQASLLLSAWQSGTINRWWGSGLVADDPDGDSRHQPASSPIPRGIGVTKGPSGEERAAGRHALTTSDTAICPRKTRSTHHRQGTCAAGSRSIAGSGSCGQGRAMPPIFRVIHGRDGEAWQCRVRNAGIRDGAGRCRQSMLHDCLTIEGSP
jgi:hypothetical protein